jgi:hypothetical protein
MVADLRRLDSADNCRIRLLSIRTRIETNWPAGGGFLFRRAQGLDPASHAVIADLLVSLPTPLPMRPGGEPEAIILDTDTDLRAVAGRAVDAALALLDGVAMESKYPGDVTMLDSYRPDAREPIVVSEPTVGLLVATVIGTLEAIYERITPATATAPGKTLRARPGRGQVVQDATAARGLETRRRGRGVPRI